MTIRIVQHYKNKCLYQIIGPGTHTETGENVMIYKSLKDGRVWVRPLDMFNEFVEVDGHYVPRFSNKGDIEV